MQTLFILSILIINIFAKGSGRGSGRSSGRGSGSKIRIRYRGRSRIGIVNIFSTRISSSGRYGCSKLWFKINYAMMHYHGEINYYNEYNEYNESANQNDKDRDPNIFLIYVINGTFLINHIQNSDYERTGHYITFTEDHVLPLFLEDMEAFKNNFGNDTKIIMPLYDIVPPYNNYSNVEYIDEEVYQKIMIDVITDVYDVPFYRLFPQFYATNFLFLLVNLTIIASIIYFLFFIFMHKYKFRIKCFPYIHFSVFFFLLFFDLLISSDLHIRDDYEIYLNSHFLNSFYFNIWQIIQICFIVYSLPPINNDDKSLYQYSFILFWVVIFFKDYDFNLEPGSMIIFIVFVKILYYIYALYNLNQYKKKFSYSSTIDKPLIGENNDSENYNEIFIAIIILIILEAYLLVDNGYIFYYLLFNFWLMLIVLFYPLDKKKIIILNE